MVAGSAGRSPRPNGRLRHPELKLEIPPWVFCMGWCPDNEFRGGVFGPPRGGNRTSCEPPLLREEGWGQAGGWAARGETRRGEVYARWCMPVGGRSAGRQEFRSHFSRLFPPLPNGHVCPPRKEQRTVGAAHWPSEAKHQKSVSPSHRRDCHFTDVPSSPLVKHLLKVEGGAAE